jgi:hypothetical protein
MRDLEINDLIKEFNRFYLDYSMEEEHKILAIGPERRFKQTQFNEIYHPLFLTLWVHGLDIHLKEHSDTIRDTYIKGLKECYRKEKGEFEHTMSLVIDYEAMLEDFSEERFRFTAEQIIKKISRDKKALVSRAEKLGTCMQKIQRSLEDMLKDVHVIE